jgi:lanosterol synthase
VQRRGARRLAPRATGFLRDGQLTSELPGFREEYRDPSLGGWCFSDGRHRWPVSDCTAEALSAVLAIHEAPGVLAPTERMEEERLGQAVVFLLSRQNRDGGFATYERRRGGPLLERLNPSGDVHAVHDGAVVCRVHRLGHRRACPCPGRASATSPRRGRPRHRARRPVPAWSQRSDGGYPGFWGINFTYAIFHAVRGLRACGVPADDPVPTGAARWLIAAQRGDGGWGEHYSGCLEGRYVEHPESQVVMTAWALLALMDIVDPRSEAVARGLAWLRQKQQPDGSWPQQAVNGVFFGSAMLDYRLYKSYFPAWALDAGRFPDHRHPLIALRRLGRPMHSGAAMIANQTGRRLAPLAPGLRSSCEPRPRIASPSRRSGAVQGTGIGCRRGARTLGPSGGG